MNDPSAKATFSNAKACAKFARVLILLVLYYDSDVYVCKALREPPRIVRKTQRTIFLAGVSEIMVHPEMTRTMVMTERLVTVRKRGPKSE